MHTLRQNDPQTASSGFVGNYLCCTRVSGYLATVRQSTFLFPPLSADSARRGMALTRRVEGDRRHRVHVRLGNVFYDHGNIKVPGADGLVV